MTCFKDLGLLAYRGRVAVIGSRGTIEINPRDLMATESSVYGVALGQSSIEELNEIHAGIICLFSSTKRA